MAKLELGEDGGISFDERFFLHGVAPACSRVTTSAGAKLAIMTGELEELLVSSEVQTARDRIEDYDAAETAADANPRGEQELADLREAMENMPGAVRMLLEAIDRAGANAGQPQYDPGDRAAFRREEAEENQ
jgi:hypothetical protein